MRPRVAVLLAALCALVPGAAAAQTSPAERQALLPDLEDEVMCPVCGTTLEASEAPQAERERALIRRLIDEGLGKEEIKDRLVAEYGPEVLATPESGGFDLAAWMVPVALLAAGAALVGTRLVRRGRAAPAAADPSPAPGAEDLKRLEADLREHDL